MKIRTDFVTNSSSSSFVCIRIQSEKLKELFEKYNFNAFSNDDEYNIVIREEDEIGTNDVDSIEGILSVLIEDLEMYCEDDLIEEINNNYDDIINSIEYADYEYSSEGWDEFEDGDEDECFFVYQSAEHLMKSLHKEDDEGKEFTKDEKGTCNCDNSKESTKILLNKPLKENLLNSIATSDYHTVGLKFDGTVISTKIDEPDYEIDGPDYDSGQTDVSDWSDIISVAAGDHHTIGLKADGTVVSTTVKTSDYPYVKYDGQCDVQDWKDIISISSEFRYTIGLKSDGTVVAVGDNGCGQCNVQKWKDIVAIQAADYFTVGLKSDGSVIVTKVTDKALSQPEVKDWKNIISISASNGNILALKPDGTVLCEAPYRSRLFTEVQDWKDIIAISAGGAHAVGLKSDGTVVATGDNEYGQCDVQDWKDIVAIFAGGLHTIGLKKDGTVVSTELEPAYNRGQCNVQNLKDIAIDLSVFATKFDESNSCKSIDFSNYKSEQCDTKNGEKVVVNNDFSIVVPDGFRCSFNKSKNKLSCDCGGTPYLFYIYKGKCNKDPDDIYDDVLYQYDFVFAFENRLEDERITPKANVNLSVNGAERDVFDVPFHDEYVAKCCVRYEDESSIIYGFVIHLYGVLYSGSVRLGNMSNESDCRKQFESILKSIQPLTKKQNQNNVVVEKKTINKNQINYKDCDFEEVDVMASRKKMLASLDYRRQEEKPKGCDIKLLSLKEIFKDNEDLAVAVNASCDFSMSDETKKHREEILQKAQKFAKIFRVSPEEFDSEYDRESEIRSGYIKHIYGWAALKSLVYTGNKYAQSMKTTLFDLSIDELVALSDFIESRGGANFKIRGNGRDTWMTAIRNQFETNCFFGNWKIARFLHYFDKRFWDDKSVPLNDLIENLYDLIPVMEKIKDYIDEDESKINSAIAEILITWCTFSIACKELFYIAKGDKKYSLQQADDDFIEISKIGDLVKHEDSGVVTYKNYAVAYERNDERVVVPDGAEYFVAEKHEDLTELVLPSSLKTVNSDNGINEFCRFIKKIAFSEGTEVLGKYVFLDFSFSGAPEEIVLPKSLKVIESTSLSKTLYKVRYNSYALEYCEKNNLKYEIVYTPEELKEKENGESYSIALSEYNQCTIASLNKAIELFDKLNGFKDSFEMSRKAQEKIDLIKKQEEERRLEQERRLEEERRLAEARRLEEERILAERKAAKQSLITERNSLFVVIEQNKNALFGERAKLKKEAKARILEIDIELAKYSDLD